MTNSVRVTDKRTVGKYFERVNECYTDPIEAEGGDGVLLLVYDPHGAVEIVVPSAAVRQAAGGSALARAPARAAGY